MKKLVLAAMLGLAAAGGQAEAFTLPFLNKAEKAQPKQPVVLAQAGNEAVRVQQLQEEIRQLNGRIEEMSFQLLQMQEQIRKAQEDNEFRFQELEKSEGGGSGNRPAVAAAPAEGSKKNDELSQIIEQNPGGMSGQGASSQAPSGQGTAAPPPTTLGSIEMDQAGMPKGATMNQGANNSSRSLPGVETGSRPSTGNGTAGARNTQQTAALGNEGEAYRAAYGHVLSGDYKIAEREFTDYIAAHPKTERAADAHFWLGEAQYSQGKYNEAAKTFLDAHKAFGTSPKAPEMLLKLGMSLAALDNKETACATLKEVTRRYPNAQRAVTTKVGSEQKRLGC